MFAQSILEYGSVASFTAAMRSLGEATLNALSDVPQSTWVIIGLICLVVLLLAGRRPRRF